jgi:hypothetical protein
MKKYLFYWAMLMIAVSAFSDAIDKDPPQRTPSVILVSMIDLIAKPELYHHKRVHVLGFLRLEFEGNALYFSRVDAEYRNTKNGLWVEVDPKGPFGTLNNKWVRVEGEFDRDDKGHLGIFSGTIKTIKRVEPLRKYSLR